MNIEIRKKIREMAQEELQRKMQASKKEKCVRINPDSLIGREITHQTVLLSAILKEAREQTKLLQSIKERSGVHLTSNQVFLEDKAE